MKTCFHCGDPCDTTLVSHDEKDFCCHGCKTVYEILNENDLLNYYSIENAPGKTPLGQIDRYDFLENEGIINQLLEFNEQNTQIVSFTIPHIHCSSCIWVLENLNKLNPAVSSSQVNFPEKSIRITFNSNETTLKELVILLSRIGYEPTISLDDFNKKAKTTDRSMIYKLGVAGFAFGNIMFLSFPEYFEVDEFWLLEFSPLFRWLMFAFSLPVVFYSGRDYFISAYKGLRSGILNIDVPIAIGIVVLFLRSSVEIIMDWGTGFFDSLSGLIFFLLLGKFFQQKTYAFLSFERDYKSYFPIAVTQLIVDDSAFAKAKFKEVQTPVYELAPGDRILLRSNELIPTDGLLVEGTALIDYSFVTGEAEPLTKNIGDKIYAGGRQKSGVIEIAVTKSVEQSYLTQLWNNEVFERKAASTFETITDTISKKFTVSILSIAVVASVIWLFIDVNTAFNVFTAVLIVACPCAIALAAPFTLGNMLRIYGRLQLYLKQDNVIEKMAKVDAVVFDKTGTLTSHHHSKIKYEGQSLTDQETNLLTSTLRASNHPLSRSLYELLNENNIITLDDFKDETGLGVQGTKGNTTIKIGSLKYTNHQIQPLNNNATQVHISINEVYKGCYVFQNSYREGMPEMFQSLSSDCKLFILSGDNDGESNFLKTLLPESAVLRFNQKPDDKLNFIKELQDKGLNIMMIGDGLNDAGALAQSNVGIAVSEDVNVFSPACDGIIDASRLKHLADYLRLSHKSISIIKSAFIFSLFYNMIGLGFAVTGNLAPVVAAILMPVSSISIVIFTTVYTYFIGTNSAIKP
jgi:Cu+-exporting ATPase